MSYELRDHTADVAVEATADTLAAVFAAVADGLTAASAESVPSAGERFELAVTAESREALLFDYLDRLIYERDVRLVLPAANRCTVVGPGEGDQCESGEEDQCESGEEDQCESDKSHRREASGDRADAGADSAEWRLVATARGVPLDAVVAREIKAVTYSEMTLERRGDEWYAYVVFDV